MQEWKKILALVSITVFAGGIFLHWVMFGKVLDDPEFDAALLRAEQTGITEIDLIREYPFSPVTRTEAAIWYVLLAQDIWLVPPDDEACEFQDIEQMTIQQQEMIHLSCLYKFFRGTNDHFYGNQYVTKATSLVALMRGLSPGRTFPEVDPYRTPYVNLAHAQGITKRPNGPYLMYLVSKYELLLQLRRVKQLKSSW